VENIYSVGSIRKSLLQTVLSVGGPASDVSFLSTDTNRLGTSHTHSNSYCRGKKDVDLHFHSAIRIHGIMFS
jgi:hypothetical protein